MSDELHPALAPPSARSHAALGLTAAAARGSFELQVCDSCGTVQYPPRDACVNCLTGHLTWQEQSGAGLLLAMTVVHHSTDPYFRAQGPWRIGLVRLESNVTVIAHVHEACATLQGEAPVRVRALLDRSGQGVLFAAPKDLANWAAGDRRWSEMTSAP